MKADRFLCEGLETFLQGKSKGCDVYGRSRASFPFYDMKLMLMQCLI